ncbi:reverse transcriptase domain-containing protein [Tanacetum coccineum]
MLKSELEKLKQEKETNQLKIENFDNASKSLDKLLESQIPDKSRKGLGFVSYNFVPPLPIGLFSTPNLDLSNSGLEEFQQPEFEGYKPKTSKNVSEDTSNKVRESPDAPLVEELVLTTITIKGKGWWKRISEKMTKNQAKTDKTEHGMKEHEKTKSNQSQSQQKSKSTPTKSTVKVKAETEEILNGPTRTYLMGRCMRTRSQSRNLNRQQQQAPPAFVEPFNLEEPIENPAPPVVTMDDTRTMAQLLEAPTEGYEDAIVVPEITTNNFELKHGLLTLVQNKQFFGHDKEDPHAHIRYFNKITSTMKFPNVPSTSVKLMLFPFSLEGAARIWLEKEPPRSILTWDDLVSKFINKFFPPSKTTNLRNEITRFQQRFDETFYEAWDRFNNLLRACPHHGFLELHQLDTFYNDLNSNDQDSLNTATGGNFLDKMPRECLRIIESKSKVRNSRNKPVFAKVGTSTSTSSISPEVAVLTTDVAQLKDMMKTLILDKQKSQAPATVKAVEEKCVTCGGAHSYRNCPATDGNVYRENIQEYVSQAAVANFNQGNTGYRAPIANQIRPTGFPPVNQPPAYQAPAYQAPAPQTKGVTRTDFESYVKANDMVMQNIQTNITTLTNSNLELKNMFSQFMKMNTASSSGTGSLPSNTVTNPKEDLKGITTRSGVAYQGPTIPTTSSSPKVLERKTEVTKDTMLPTNNGSTKDVQPPVVQVQPHVPNSETVVTPVSAPMPNPKPSIPYPSRRNDERRREKANDQIEKFYKIFKDLSFEISLTDALILMYLFWA